MTTYHWGDRKVAASTNGHRVPAPPSLSNTLGDLGRYAAYLQAALELEQEAVEEALEGTRNDTLNRAAYNLGQLCPRYIAETTLEAHLISWGRRAGLEAAETAKTVASGLRAGMAEPRMIILREPDVEITDVTTEGPSAHERAVAKEVSRLRVQAEARETLAAEGRPARQPFRVATAGEVLAGPEEPPGRIQDVVGWAASTLITAQRKCGKTTLLLNLTRSLLLGEPFLGRFPVKPLEGRVALLNYEVSARQLARWAAEAEVPLEGLLLVNLRGGSNPLAYHEERAELAAELRSQGVEALLTDPFARAFTGTDQNSSGEVMPFLLMLEQFCRADVGALDLFLTTHAGWNAERSRGASALEDWPDTIITMTREDNGPRYLRAIGRDVELEEDQLSYVESVRRLLLTGEGSRREAQSSRRDLELEAEVSGILAHHDMIGILELRKLLVEEGVKFRKGDETKAVNRLIAKGLVWEEQGPRRARLLHKTVLID